METTFTFTLNQTAKTGRITSTEDFEALGFNLSNAAAKVLGTISFQTEQIISRETVGNPLINLASGATYFDFDLELDNDEEIANGAYQFDLSLRMAPTGLQFSSTGTTTVVAGDGNPEYGLFLQAGDVLVFSPGSVQRTIESVVVASGVATYTLTESINLDSFDSFGFDVTHDTFEDSYTYSGCDLTTADVAFTFDCDYGDNGTWTVSNTTDLTDATLSSLSGTINFPSWTGEDPISVTSLPYVNNTLATGTYSANITMVLTQTQDDGLIIQYSSQVIKEATATCVGSLCGVNPCIQSLLTAHYAALELNKVSQYQKYVDTVALQYIRAQNFKACGEYENYQAALAAIQTALDASGCDCDCCDDDTYFWVQNTSTETATALEQAQADIVVLQNNSCIYEAPSIITDSTAYYPAAAGNLRLAFSDVSEITIAKEFFDTDPNGFATKGITIEVTTYTSVGQSLYITNQDDNRVWSAGSASDNDVYTRHFIKLSTALYSGIVMCTAFGESLEVDASSGNAVDIPYNYSNASETLWDLTEDLVLGFHMSANNANCAITRLRIQAFQY